MTPERVAKRGSGLANGLLLAQGLLTANVIDNWSSTPTLAIAGTMLFQACLIFNAANARLIQIAERIRSKNRNDRQPEPPEV